MNRRNFLRSLFASSAAIVVAPADILPTRSYFDMGASETRRLENLAAQCRAVMIDWSNGEVRTWTYEGSQGEIYEAHTRWALVS